MKKSVFFIAIAALSLSSSLAVPVSLELKLMNGDQPFQFGKPISLKNGQKLDIETVKMYVSNVALVKSDGREVPVKGINLMKLKAGQKAVLFKGEAPAGDYRGVRFNIGLPREINHLEAAIAKAPLSVEDGMFWAWNSGYIFMGIEGKTKVAGAEKEVALHVGGDNNLISVNLSDIQKPGTAVKLSSTGHTFPVHLDLAALFVTGVKDEAWDLSQKKYQQVHMGAVANQFAVNAKQAFITKKKMNMKKPASGSMNMKEHHGDGDHSQNK